MLSLAGTGVRVQSKSLSQTGQQGDPIGSFNPPLSTSPSRQVDVTITEPFSQELSIELALDRPEEWLSGVVACALQVALPPNQAGQVSLLVADDTMVRELNRQFRGLDEVTDVLSFSPSHPGYWEGVTDGPDHRDLEHGVSGEPSFILPPDELPYLGDVVIAYPQARRQSLVRNEPVAKELARLISHAVLHLLGYDHQQSAEAALMQTREDAALSLILSNQLLALSSIPSRSRESES